MQQSVMLETVEDLEADGITDELFGIFAEMKAVALFKTHSSQTACGVLHKAQGVQNTNKPVFDIALAAEEIDQMVGILVQAHGERIDGEIAAGEIHFER